MIKPLAMNDIFRTAEPARSEPPAAPGAVGESFAEALQREAVSQDSTQGSEFHGGADADADALGDADLAQGPPAEASAPTLHPLASQDPLTVEPAGFSLPPRLEAEPAAPGLGEARGAGRLQDWPPRIKPQARVESPRIKPSPSRPAEMRLQAVEAFAGKMQAQFACNPRRSCRRSRSWMPSS